jgi:hypothetical protein
MDWDGACDDIPIRNGVHVRIRGELRDDQFRFSLSGPGQFGSLRRAPWAQQLFNLGPVERSGLLSFPSKKYVFL